MPPLDYRSAFEHAPVGMVLSRNRQMLDCNRHLLAMFGAERDALVGRSFELLYPTPGELERTGERIAARLNASGWYADERVMRRVGGSSAGPCGELFWCRVSGRAPGPLHPHAEGIWSFEDLSSRRHRGASFASS